MRRPSAQVPDVPDIYRYSEWRPFIRDWLTESEEWSRSALARAMGCRPSHVTNILHEDPAKQRRLTDTYAEKLLEVLALPDPQEDFFRLLVEYEQAPEGSATRERAFAHIHAANRFREAHQPELDQYALFSRWYNVAILELSNHADFRDDPAWIREQLQPRVSREEVAEALELLVRLRMLERGKDGQLRRVHTVVEASDTRGTENELMRRARTEAGFASHRWMLRRGQEALSEFTPKERYFTAGTVLVPVARVPELRRMFYRWQQEWLNLMEEDVALEEGGRRTGPARVYRLNLQFFPLSETVGED